MRRWVWSTKSSIDDNRIGRGRTTAVALVSHVASMALTKGRDVGPSRPTRDPGPAPRAWRMAATPVASSKSRAHSTRSADVPDTKVTAPERDAAARSIRERRVVIKAFDFTFEAGVTAKYDEVRGG